MDDKAYSVSGNDEARPWKCYDTVYTNAKAGMEGVEREKVQRIVYEMSKGSKYFENEERKKALMKQKIENMRELCAKFTSSELAHYQKIADKRVVELESTRDLSRIWLHVDMDAFYAAVETLSNPFLKGKPMAVGGLSMISTANYEARKFGVRAAMPGFIAKKLCPELIFVPTDFKKYTYYSDLTRKVYQKYDPDFFAASLDEAYLDITNFCSDKRMTGGQVAEELRESVHKETGLTCSAGVAPNRLLAKVCSDINKPNGQFLLPNDHMAVLTFVSSLPVRRIGGIGKVTENVLKDVLGIATCQEILQKSGFIYALFSLSSADFFLSVGLGLGRTDTPLAILRKSISTERTFSSTENEESLVQKLADLSENLSADLKKESLSGKTLTLKLKTSCFEVRTRAMTLPHYISSTEDILKHGMKLLKAELPVSLRLMGLRLSHFNEDSKAVAVDPKQRTLSSFILTENDDSGRRLGDDTLSDSYHDNDKLSMVRENDFSTKTQGVRDSIDAVDTNQVPSLHDTDFTHCGSEAEDGVVDHGTSSCSGKVLPTEAGGYSSSMRASYTNDDSNPILWLKDCSCSVCGIEIPNNFVVQRQEHLDFHLAEKLQEEESSFMIRFPTSRQSLTQKNRKVRHSAQKKKQKTSPSDGGLTQGIIDSNGINILNFGIG